MLKSKIITLFRVLKTTWTIARKKEHWQKIKIFLIKKHFNRKLVYVNCVNLHKKEFSHSIMRNNYFSQKLISVIFSLHLQDKETNAAALRNRLVDPLSDVADVIIEAVGDETHRDTIGAGIGALQEAVKHINNTFSTLLDSHLALEVKLAHLEHSNLLLRKRSSLMLGECFQLSPFSSVLSTYLFFK